jgi:phosphate:Na+ symporter
MNLKLKSLLLLLVLCITSVGSLYAQDSTTVNTELSGEIFKNINAKGIENGAKFSWVIDYDKVEYVENVIIKYQKKVEKGKPWKYSPVISGKTTSFSLEGMTGGDKYVWMIGCLKDGGDIATILNNGIPESEDLVWSNKAKYQTERAWGLFKILVLIGSLGLFIFGMKLMSEGLQQTAGGGLRKILSTMTSNRFLGVLSGFLITAIVQSSSATTVMTVSFVNAGLLTLLESAGVMMGANIGTTITGWLVSLFGFKISLSTYALIFIALGAPLMFMSKKNLKGWANAIIGFAILFMGLGFLKNAVPDLGADSPIVQFFTGFSDSPWLGRIAFVLLGTLVTIVVQSSSAAMALTLTMVLKWVQL